jgi:uncharacterized membrane protein
MEKHGVILVLTWLHVLAAVSWIGGMVFLSLVLVPVLRRDGVAAQRIVLFRTIAVRFRALVWGSIAVLLGTGLLLLLHRGIALGDDVTTWPRVLLVKLTLVVLLLLLTLLHDVVVGPRVSQTMEIPDTARTSFDRVLVLASPWLPRVSLVVALGVLLSAVMLARS